MDIINIYNVDEGFMLSHIVYTKGAHTEEHSFRHYVFTLGAVKRLLAQYGLYVIAAYGSLSKAVFNLGDPQVYIVAKKR